MKFLLFPQKTENADVLWEEMVEQCQKGLTAQMVVEVNSFCFVIMRPRLLTSRHLPPGDDLTHSLSRLLLLMLI